MPPERLDYESPSDAPGLPPRPPVTRKRIVIPAILLFGGGTITFVYLAAAWSRQSAVDSQHSVRTDGLQLSVWLAWFVASLLLLGTVAACVELARGIRRERRDERKDGADGTRG